MVEEKDTLPPASPVHHKARGKTFIRNKHVLWGIRYPGIFQFIPLHDVLFPAFAPFTSELSLIHFGLIDSVYHDLNQLFYLLFAVFFHSLVWVGTEGSSSSLTCSDHAMLSLFGYQLNDRNTRQWFKDYLGDLNDFGAIKFSFRWMKTQFCLSLISFYTRTSLCTKPPASTSEVFS